MAEKYLQQFIPFVDAIAKTFGNNCEVVLHDLSNPEKSIIRIANGHVTGRKVGGPITDLGLLLLAREKNNPKNDSLIGYHSTTRKGVELKSTTIFIRNSKGKIVGFLCINIDISPFIFMKNMVTEICKTSTLNKENESPEKFEPSVDSLINQLLRQAVEKCGKAVVHMKKEDKLEVIRALKEKELFHIKGSAKRISKELNVSLATIYKYLEET
jgi:predicted transcriptional regulator YheO